VIKAGGGSLFIASEADAEVTEEGKVVNDPLKAQLSFKELNLYARRRSCDRD
jgi:hypothetical protein